MIIVYPSKQAIYVVFYQSMFAYHYEKVISNVEISLNILVEGRQVYNEVVWQSYALELDQY
jgi:hypothetical protein